MWLTSYAAGLAQVEGPGLGEQSLLLFYVVLSTLSGLFEGTPASPAFSAASGAIAAAWMLGVPGVVEASLRSIPVTVLVDLRPLPETMAALMAVDGLCWGLSSLESSMERAAERMER